MSAEKVDPQLLTVLTTEHFVLQTARGGSLQMLYTAAAMVATLNAIVLGTGVGMLLRAGDTAPMGVAVAVGAVLAIAAFVGQLVLQRRRTPTGWRNLVACGRD